MCIRFRLDMNVIDVIVIVPREQVGLHFVRFLLRRVRAKSLVLDGFACSEILAVNHDPRGDWTCSAMIALTIMSWSGEEGGRYTALPDVDPGARPRQSHFPQTPHPGTFTGINPRAAQLPSGA
jgi:hypothetical protein